MVNTVAIDENYSVDTNIRGNSVLMLDDRR